MDCALVVEGQEGVSWADWAALAATCESVGIAGLYRSDHYVSFTHPEERGGLDAWASLSALAAVTTSLRLGTLVSPVGFRPAGMLAKLVAGVDEISGGRAELGLGAGWFEREFRAFGLPFPSLRERYVALDETLAVLSALLRRSAEPTSFDGRYVSLADCQLLPPVVQTPGPPIILGGDAGPMSAALAAQWADEYNVLEVSPELVDVRRRALEEACRAHRRDPETLGLSLMINTVVGRDSGEVRDRVARVLELTADDRTVDEALAARGDDVLTGTPDEVLERLRDYSAAGVRRVMLQHIDHTDLDMVRLIGERIVPRLGDL
jgi:alkanesulfonate monooxygenase SsuD/methylene tetrahydromethanopterin reductase-like flavin-dependent oxidoreductase (luciferase family)